MKQTITIKGVDVKLLEKQRKIINRAVDRMDFETITLFGEEEVDALQGVMNMLDSWSDEIYHIKQSFSCKFCHRPVDPAKAHLHDGEYVGECCWDERLRATE